MRWRRRRAGGQVHVVDNKVQRQYGDYFATHIMKNERMALEISRIAEVITTEI